MARETKGVSWYDIPGSGWLRDLWVICHFPYTCWHLSYIPIGAAMAPEMNWSTLGWTVLAFFLAMGIGGHCLDELNGRTLRTEIPTPVLWTIAVMSIAGAVSIGIFIGLRETIWVLPCILFGGFIVFAYNLEWGRGFFHHDYYFGVAWGAFPVITSYIAQTHTLSIAAIVVGVFALLYSMAQRTLSLQARYFRRKVGVLEGQYYLHGETPSTPGVPGLGAPHPITRDTIIGPADLALKYMTWAVVSVAISLLLIHI